MAGLHYYLAYFLLFSVVGYLFEWVINSFSGTLPAGRCPDRLLNKVICLPMLTIYGLGAVVLLLFMDQAPPGMATLWLAVIAGLMLSGLECVIGNLSTTIFGGQGWHYNHPLTLCNGQISLPVALMWMLLAYMFMTLRPFIDQLL